METCAAAETASGTGKDYKPKISIRIDLDDNSLMISDNGIGLDKEKFERFVNQLRILALEELRWILPGDLG